MDLNEQGWNAIGEFNRNYSDIGRIQIELAYRELKYESDEMNRTGNLPEEKKQNETFAKLRLLEQLV